jgi:peptide/nickel transport system substrate-binding protein
VLRLRSAFVVLSLLAFCAFGAVTALGAARVSGSTLRVAVDAEDVDQSDPAVAFIVLSEQIDNEECEPLVGYSDATGSVSSSLSPLGAADMPVISNDGRTYTFTLRSGMQFSNGDPITAANYKFAFDRDALSGLYSPASTFVAGFIKGWSEENKSADESITSVSGVTASSPDTLTIALKKPDPLLLSKLALPFFCPIDQAAPFWDGTTWADQPVEGPWPGSGPYYLSDRVPGAQMTLKKNTFYNGTQAATSDTIVIDMNLSSKQAYDGIAKGKYAVDLRGNPEPGENKALAQEFGVNQSRFWVFPRLSTTYLWMDERGPFRSLRLRQAFNYVLDRPAFVKAGGYLSGTPTVQVVPTELTGGVASVAPYPTTTPGPQQIALARKLSHNCRASQKRPFFLGYPAGALGAREAHVVIGDLRKMGCRVFASGGPGDLTIAGWIADFPDGYDFLRPLLDGRTGLTGYDYSHFHNALFNWKLDQANLLADPDERAKAFGKLDGWVMKAYAPLAPAEERNFLDFLSANAHGYVFNGPFASVDLGYLYQS